MATSAPDQLIPLLRNRQRCPRAPGRGWHRGVLDAPCRAAPRHPRALDLQTPAGKETLQAANISTGFEEQAAFSDAALGDAEGLIGALARAYRYRAGGAALARLPRCS